MIKLIQSAIICTATTFSNWTDYEFYICREDYDEEDEIFTCVIGFYNSPLYTSFDVDIEFKSNDGVDDIMYQILKGWERRHG